MSLIQNERTKLLATALNNTAVATLVTAVIAPTAGLLNGSTPPITWVWWALLEITWFLVGLGLHLAAQAVLGRLKS